MNAIERLRQLLDEQGVEHYDGREFIVTSDQMKTIAEAVSETIGKPITEVVVSGDKLPKIVRCRDCEELSDALGTPWCDEFDHGVSLNGYCAWGKRRDA